MSLIWKTNDRRAKQRAIWDRQQNKYRAPLTLWHSCHIGGSFGSLAIFLKMRYSKCCFWYKLQSRFIRLLLDYRLSGLNKTTFWKF